MSVLTYPDRGRIVYFIVVFLVLPYCGQAQTWNEFKDDLEASWQTTKNLGSLIAQPGRDDLTILALSSGLVVSSYFLDQTSRDFTRKNQTGFLNKVARIDQYYGNRRIMIGAPILLYASGFIAGNKDIKKMGLHSFQAIVYAGTITAVVKEIFGRSRPDENLGPHHFKPFAFREGSRSFFSGHSSVTFATSTVMAKKIDNIAWKIFWYGAASLVAGARVYNDRHWFSDVFAGALVGYAIGNFVSRQAEKEEKRLETSIQSKFSSKDNFLLSISIPLRD